jgi:hypothetical protein
MSEGAEVISIFKSCDAKEAEPLEQEMQRSAFLSKGCKAGSNGTGEQPSGNVFNAASSPATALPRPFCLVVGPTCGLKKTQICLNLGPDRPAQGPPKASIMML